MIKGEMDVSKGLLTVVDNVLRYVLMAPRAWGILRMGSKIR
jgi:hypothetical protein